MVGVLLGGKAGEVRVGETIVGVFVDVVIVAVGVSAGIVSVGEGVSVGGMMIIGDDTMVGDGIGVVVSVAVDVAVGGPVSTPLILLNMNRPEIQARITRMLAAIRANFLLDNFCP